VKVGDLVRYIDYSHVHDEQIGIILDGPRRGARVAAPTAYKVYWVVEKKIGWWDHFRLEKIACYRSMPDDISGNEI
jgi:hypothetical protein